MAKALPEWKQIEEYIKVAAELRENYPDQLDHIDLNEIIAWGIINKDRPEGKAKQYEMTTDTEPNCFTNKKKYFVTFYQADWDNFNTEQKQWVVFSSLMRIDPAKPGKIRPLDYRDQAIMIEKVGPNWASRKDLPNMLKNKVDFSSGETADEETEE